MKKWARKKLIRFLTKHLFNTVTADDLLRGTGNTFVFQGKLLDIERAQKLKDDAQAFRNSTIWNILINEMKFHANLRIYHKSKDADDLIFGKAMLYTIKVLEDKISTLK